MFKCDNDVVVFKSLSFRDSEVFTNIHKMFGISFKVRRKKKSIDEARWS